MGVVAIKMMVIAIEQTRRRNRAEYRQFNPPCQVEIYVHLGPNVKSAGTGQQMKGEGS
jgi:hypothetical protein